MWRLTCAVEVGSVSTERMPNMIWLLALSAVTAAAATAEDLWRRRISNWISGLALAAGLAAHLALGGWSGLGDSALGALIGFAAFLLFFLMGGMGGGDVKLMAAFGAILGSKQILMAAILAAMAGGLMALVFVAYQAARRALGKGSEASPIRKQYIPYAPAISFGALLSFLSEDELWTNVY